MVVCGIVTVDPSILEAVKCHGYNTRLGFRSSVF